MTVFTGVGCYFVEQTYVQYYGEAYRRVQRTRPLLIPRLPARKTTEAG